MSYRLKERVAHLERDHRRGDWRQFGSDPRDYPDWALLASLLEDLERRPEYKNRAEIVEARSFYEAGQIEAAFSLLRPLLGGE